MVVFKPNSEHRSATFVKKEAKKIVQAFAAQNATDIRTEAYFVTQDSCVFGVFEADNLDMLDFGTTKPILDKWCARVSPLLDAVMVNVPKNQTKKKDTWQGERWKREFPSLL